MRRAVVAVTLTLLSTALGGCSGSSDEAGPTAATSAQSSPTVRATPSPTPRPTPTATTTPQPLRRDIFVDLSCTSGGSTVEVAIPRETADFTQAWAVANGGRCETAYTSGAQVTVSPTTELEKSAYAASGYTNHDIRTLYGICAAVRPDDVVLQPTHVMSAPQVAEAQGALTLCPGHPLAPLYLDAIDKATNPDRKAELPVYGGKHLVGTDIPAGTYKTTGTEWDACYWARVKGDGTIIENGFVTYAPEGITVTLQAGEGFETEGCGSWLKVG